MFNKPNKNISIKKEQKKKKIIRIRRHCYKTVILNNTLDIPT